MWNVYMNSWTTPALGTTFRKLCTSELVLTTTTGYAKTSQQPTRAPQ